MLAKDMHKILQIEFKKLHFSASEDNFPLRHPHCFNGQKFIMSNKGIKTRKGGRNRHENSQYFIENE